MSLHCLIVDDSVRFGDEARSLLELEGVPVVGVATSGGEAVRLAEELRPDLALVDVGLQAPRAGSTLPAGSETHWTRRRRRCLRLDVDEEEFSGSIEARQALGFIAKTGLSAERIRRLLGG